MSSTSQQKLANISGTVLHKRSDLHLLRKIWHIVTGTLGLYFFHQSDLSQNTWGLMAFAIAIIGFSVDFLRSRSPQLNKIIVTMMGPLMRRSERKGVTGLPFYALGVSLSLFFYIRPIAVLSVMFLVFSDPLSSFFGILYGKDKILPNKSLQGAIAGFFTCYLITLFYVTNSSELGNHLILFSILSGLLGALSELASAFKVDDNLTIPVISGLGMTLLNFFFNIF